MDDLIIGALGELAVVKMMRKKGYWVRGPDFSIYSAGNKTFDADLSYKGMSFHIKSQSMDSASKYGNSYLMQRQDPLLKNSPKNNFMVPTLVDTDKNIVKVYGYFPVDKIIENDLIGECSIPYFRKYKVALYLDDLLTLPYYHKWGIWRKLA